MAGRDTTIPSLNQKIITLRKASTVPLDIDKRMSMDLLDISLPILDVDVVPCWIPLLRDIMVPAESMGRED